MVKRKNKTLTKLLATILSVLIICCSLPISAMAASDYITDIGNNSAEFGVINGSYQKVGHELHYATYAGRTYITFCAQWGVPSPTDRVYDASEMTALWNSPEYQKIAQYIYFGYTMKYGDGLPSNDDAYRDASATQQYVWEALGVYPSRSSWKPSYMSDSIYNSWLAETESYYNLYNGTEVSFDNTTITLNYGKSMTITDTNNVLQYFPTFDKTIDGIKYVHSQGANTLAITATTDVRNHNVTFNSRNEGIYQLLPNGSRYDFDTMNYVYFQFKDSNVQNLIFSNYVDPSWFALNVNIEWGDIDITKQDHWAASVDGAIFGLFTDAGCTSKVTEATSSGGKVKFDYLEPRSYYLKELSAPEGYLLDETVVTVNVENNKTATKTITNNEPLGNITLTKELDTAKTNGKFGDVKITEATYTLVAKEDITSKAGSKTFYKAGEEISTKHISNINDVTGKVTWEDLPLGKYTVYEKTAPYGTFIDTNKYDVTLSYKGQTEPVVINDKTKSTDTLKSMKVNIYKTGTNGDAVVLDGIEGAEFTIKLKADYENALEQGYTYNEIWASKNADGQYEVNGKVVTVSDARVKKANEIAPSYDVITTDAEGNAVSTYLPYGWYICKETKTPTDFESCTDFSFKIENDESEMSVEKQVKFIVPNNTPFEAPVEILKEDVDSGKLVTLSSTFFKIRATEDIYDTSTGNIKYAKGDYVRAKVGSSWYDTFMTNSDGFVVPTSQSVYASTNDQKGTVTTPFKFPVGSYEVVEFKTADGFLLPEGNKPFIITSIANTATDADGDITIPVLIKNEQPKANIIVNKSFVKRDNMDFSLINDIDYTKVGFELTVAEDIIDKSDGSIVYEKGKVLGRYYLDANGKLNINDLWIGEYNLKEFATIDGAVLDETIYSVKFEATDNTTKEYEETFNIVNYTTEVDFTKTDVTGEKEIEGAKLAVVDKDNNVIDKWISTTESHKIEGLKINETYTLVEELASNGIVTANAIYFTVNNTTEIQSVTMKDKTVEFIKTDVNGKFLKGAELTIIDKNNNIVDEWITGQHLFDMTEEIKSELSKGNTASGFFTNENNSTVKYVIAPIEAREDYSLMLQSDRITSYYIVDINGDETSHLGSGLIEGQLYHLNEVSAPNEYVKAQPIEFEVTNEKENQLVTMIDKQVEVSKIDVTTGEELEGAELTVTDTEGTVIDSWISTDEVHYVSGLEEGKTYILTEVIAPNGIITAESIEFTVSTDKLTQKVVMMDKFVGIAKTDVNGELIKGAELEVTNNKTKQVVDKWITGQHLFDVTEEIKTELSEGNSVSDFFINDNDSTVKYVITPIDESDNYSLMLQSDGITDYFVIDINGDETIHLASGLIEGQLYHLNEVSAPNEYVKAQPIEFEVTNEKENQLVTMIDKQVEVSKIDITTGEELEGAELTVTDTEGTVIDNWISTDEVHYVSGLEEGKTYILTEVTAPYGYKIAESIEFTVSTDKETQKIVMEDDYIYSSVRVVKCDITTKNPIVSNEFEFSIYADKKCKELLAISGANKDEGTALFENLIYGTYYIAETKAPLGYSLSNQIVEIVINESGVTADGVSLEGNDGVYSFEYYDELLPVINTGDTNNIVKVVVMGSLVVAFAVIFILTKKKMKKNKKNIDVSNHFNKK